MAPFKGCIYAQYKEIERVLKAVQSTTKDKIAAIASLRDQFAHRIQPPFNDMVFGTLISTVRNDQADPSLRNEAADTICAIIETHDRMTASRIGVHALIEEGVLAALGSMVSTSTDVQIIEKYITCVTGLLNRNCRECRRLVMGDPRLFAAIANNMLPIVPIDTRRALLWSICRADCSIPEREETKVEYFNVFAKVVELCGEDSEILLRSLSVVASLRPPIAVLLDEDGVLTRCINYLLEKRNQKDSAIYLIEYVMSRGSDGQVEMLCMREGFLRTIVAHLSPEQGRYWWFDRSILRILDRITTGPPQLVDLLLTDHNPIPRLLEIMNDVRCHSWSREKVESLLLNILDSFAHSPRPAKLQMFLGEGVVSALVRRGCGYANQLSERVIRIKQALLTVLQVHPEFWRAVEKEQGPIQLLAIPPRRRRAPVDYIFEDEDITDF